MLFIFTCGEAGKSISHFSSPSPILSVTVPQFSSNHLTVVFVFAAFGGQLLVASKIGVCEMIGENVHLLCFCFGEADAQ